MLVLHFRIASGSAQGGPTSPRSLSNLRRAREAHGTHAVSLAHPADRTHGHPARYREEGVIHASPRPSAQPERAMSPIARMPAVCRSALPVLGTAPTTDCRLSGRNTLRRIPVDTAAKAERFAGRGPRRPRAGPDRAVFAHSGPCPRPIPTPSPRTTRFARASSPRPSRSWSRPASRPLSGDRPARPNR